MSTKIIKKIKIDAVDLIVYDFDGVMTDNKVLVFQDGKEAVVCNRADGLAIQEIKVLGVPQIILSTEKNIVVKVRAKKLKIDVLHGVEDKKITLIRYCKENHFRLAYVLYIGNDINDYEVMKIVGYPVAPSDAYPKIKRIAKICTKKKGGDGVIKELFDTIFEYKKGD